MPRRLFALALAAAVLLLGAGCADSVSPALRVGDTKVSNDIFLAEVGEWAGNPAAVDPATLGDRSPGTYPLELVRQLMQQRIDFTLHNQEFKTLGLKLDEAMRQHALEVLFGDPKAANQAFSKFSTSFATQFTDDVARQIAVSESLGDNGYNAWRTKTYARANIAVSPRYGSWDAKTGQVLAPEGPVTAVTTPPAAPPTANR